MRVIEIMNKLLNKQIYKFKRKMIKIILFKTKMKKKLI
jgi:hypothetical protein